MSETLNTRTPLISDNYIGKTGEFVQWINNALARYSDKDWNYSRIRLTVVPVAAAQSPYLLACELISLQTPKGKRDLKDVEMEITWGEHHSSELGILEIISLRLNKALLAVVGTNLYSTGQPPRPYHPVLRLVKREDMLAANASEAIWYDVEEVRGEDFENR